MTDELELTLFQRLKRGLFGTAEHEAIAERLRRLDAEPGLVDDRGMIRIVPRITLTTSGRSDARPEDFHINPGEGVAVAATLARRLLAGGLAVLGDEDPQLAPLDVTPVSVTAAKALTFDGRSYTAGEGFAAPRYRVPYLVAAGRVLAPGQTWQSTGDDAASRERVSDYLIHKLETEEEQLW